MSAKREKELRSGIKVCEKLMELQEMTDLELEGVQKCILHQHKLLREQGEQLGEMAQEIRRLQDWRLRCLERRRDQIRRIRRSFFCLGILLMVLGYVVLVLVEKHRLLPWTGLLIIAVTAALEYICFCKSGVSGVPRDGDD